MKLPSVKEVWENRKEQVYIEYLENQNSIMRDELFRAYCKNCTDCRKDCPTLGECTSQDIMRQLLESIFGMSIAQISDCYRDTK